MTPPSHVIGVDVGATKIAAGLVRFPEGRVLERNRIPTCPDRDPEQVLNDLFEMVAALAQRARARSIAVEGIGMGVCELVDPKGELLSHHSLHWTSARIRERLGALAPVFLDADVRAGGRAEALFGEGRGRGCFVYVTIGTGISSCLLIDGVPFVGARGATGTFASSAVAPRCPSCGESSSRTLEDWASGAGLTQRARVEAQLDVDRAEDLLARADAGDLRAVAVVQSGAEAVGRAIAWLVDTLDPEVVVIGGGLGLRGGRYWNTLVSAAQQSFWSDLHRGIPILPAATGVDAGLLGAAALAWDHLGQATRAPSGFASAPHIKSATRR
ncbi:MAG: ROK family protein [Verrucomicrobiales bacterium]|nr:ROK family protein [Verrucomicrobiales bacterium]